MTACKLVKLIMIVKKRTRNYKKVICSYTPRAKVEIFVVILLVQKLKYLLGNLGYILSTFWGEKNTTLTRAISLKNFADQSRFGFKQLIWSVYFSILEMRTARPAISGNQLASIGEFECRNFSNFRLCHAIFSICSICSNIESFKTVLEHVLTLLIQKTATFSKCNGVFFGVKINAR